jgi:hypothetical protein
MVLMTHDPRKVGYIYPMVREGSMYWKYFDYLAAWFGENQVPESRSVRSDN